MVLTWVDKELSELLEEEHHNILNTNLSIAKAFGYSHVAGVDEDLRSYALPELFAFRFASSSGFGSIAQEAAALQAFQSNRISLYDIISDSHEMKKGIPTPLHLGIDHLRRMDAHYETTTIWIAQQLQLAGLHYAEQNAEQQYTVTLQQDFIRNNYANSQMTPQQTIELIERLAGHHGSMIGKLSTEDKKLHEAGFHLGIAMHTVEDLLDFLSGEDLRRMKATLPLAILHEHLPECRDKPPTEILQHPNSSYITSHVRKYILLHLQTASEILVCYPNDEMEIFSQCIYKMRKFLSELA